MDETCTCTCTCHRAGPCTFCGCRPGHAKERLLAALRAALARSEERERALRTEREIMREALRAIRETNSKSQNHANFQPRCLWCGEQWPCIDYRCADGALSQASPAPVAAPGGEGTPKADRANWHGRAYAINGLTGDHVWCGCGDAILADDARCGNCFAALSPAAPTPTKEEM